MRLFVKHVQKTKSGAWQYRRRVPGDVAGIIGKREFKQVLGQTERAALAAYPKHHARVEREIAAARLRLVRSEAAISASATEREAYAEAARRRAELVAFGVDDELLDLAADSLADRFPHEGYEPQGAPPVDRHTINLLRLGPDRYPAPAPTLSDALGVYRKEQLQEGQPGTDPKAVAFAQRVIAAAITTLGRDPLLTSLTREDARNVRDEMLDRVKQTGTGIGEKVSASTVRRELSIVAAVVAFGVREFDLPDSVARPFRDLKVVGAEKGAGDKDDERRDPLPLDILAAARHRILTRSNQALQLVWRILEGTGCRLAEVTGLRVQDVDVAGEFPTIHVTWHEGRRLKTKTSSRYVPLVGDALEAAKEALDAAQGQDVLFPKYCSKAGSNAASAALMKQVRGVTTNTKHVVHSLRHNMKDLLVLAEVASLDQNLILGHALGSVGDRVYGGDVAKLRVTTRAMKRAFGIVDGAA